MKLKLQVGSAAVIQQVSAMGDEMGVGSGSQYVEFSALPGKGITVDILVRELNRFPGAVITAAAVENDPE